MTKEQIETKAQELSEWMHKYAPLRSIHLLYLCEELNISGEDIHKIVAHYNWNMALTEDEEIVLYCHYPFIPLMAAFRSNFLNYKKYEKLKL